MKNSPLQTLIPLLIKRIRLEKKYSQEDLASLSGLDRTYISGIERGVRNLTIKSLSKLLQALDLNTEQFATELIYESESHYSKKL